MYIVNFNTHFAGFEISRYNTLEEAKSYCEEETKGMARAEDFDPFSDIIWYEV